MISAPWLRNLVITTAITAATFATPAAAAPARQPTNKWVLDYSETSCTASRAYGTEDKPVTLAIRPSPSGNVVRLMLVQRGKMFDPHHFHVKLSIVPGKGRPTALRFGSADKKLDVIWINVERPALDSLRSAGELAISGDGENDTFAVPQIDRVLDALDGCNDDLRKQWNDGPAAANKIATPAEAVKPLHELFSDADYPGQALRESASGAAELTLMIDESGTLKDCTVDATSGVATLDALGCGLLPQRAKFKPARDEAGRAIRSLMCTRILWKIS